MPIHPLINSSNWVKIRLALIPNAVTGDARSFSASLQPDPAVRIRLWTVLLAIISSYSSSALPCCRPATLFPPSDSEEVFWAGGERMSHWCLNAPSGHPHRAKSSVGEKLRSPLSYLLRVWSSWSKEMEENAFPGCICNLSHILPAPPSSLPHPATPGSLKTRVKGCRGIHCVKIHR